MSDQAYIAAPAGQAYWRYSIPPRTDAKVFLLTVGRVATVGNWRGALGEFFVAWAPLFKRDKAEEVRLGLLPPPHLRGNEC